MLDTAINLYNILLNIYKTHYDKFWKTKKKRAKFQNITERFFIDLYLDENGDDLTPISVLEGDEEVKLEPERSIAERLKSIPRKKNEGLGLKILTPNKLFYYTFKKPHIKTGNNSKKIKKWNKISTLSFVWTY